MKCKSCTTDVSITDSSKCYLCNTTYCFTCAKLTTSDTKWLRSKKNFKWTCTPCSSIDFIDHIMSLKNMISELQLQVNDLKTKPTIDDCFTKEDVVNDILLELHEQKIRESNIIIKNVTENNSFEEDSKAVTNIINQVAGGTTHDYKFFRIGPKHIDSPESSPRMIKVIFKNKSSAQCILKNSATLRTINSMKNVFINHDLTPRQIMNKRKVIEEFKKRKNDGDNIVLKYTDGLPKIISKKNL